jgi:transposase-like protein
MKEIKNTNALERILREIRRIGYFQNQRSLELFIPVCHSQERRKFGKKKRGD